MTLIEIWNIKAQLSSYNTLSCSLFLQIQIYITTLYKSSNFFQFTHHHHLHIIMKIKIIKKGLWHFEPVDCWQVTLVIVGRKTLTTEVDQGKEDTKLSSHLTLSVFNNCWTMIKWSKFNDMGKFLVTIGKLCTSVISIK